ncbi:unnamed protein product [Mytilus coruscus]|uniref:Cyclic GMP-AMP synthase n=1 Tax=Mytilus coruscus TaxID=42192 RepID=A0A6J8B8H8_MYTCO|nr:unnamed protein product [Mytilus coruscus]
MEEISQRLYTFLCERVVGSQKIVLYRRRFFDVRDEFLNCTGKKSVEYVSSGSMAEGLHFEGSDLDIMFICQLPVQNNDAKSTSSTCKLMNTHFLFLDVHIAQPGFGMIRVDQNHPKLNNKSRHRSQFGYLLSKCVVVTDFGAVLSGKKWKSINANLNFKTMSVKVNGPCLTTLDNSIDFAFALKCDNWAGIANSFFTRSRSANWPAEILLEKIRQQEHNMIDRKFEGRPREALVAILKKFYDIGWVSVLECQSMKDFNCFYTAKFAQSRHEFNIAIMPLVDMFGYAPTITEIVGNKRFDLCVDKVSNYDLSIKTRSIYLLCLICLSADIASETFYRSHQNSNKNDYSLRRKWFCHAIIATCKDSLSGWLRIALYFYFNAQYNEALKVLNYGRLTCTVEKLLTFNLRDCTEFFVTRPPHEKLQTNATFKDIRLRTMRKFMLRPEPNTAIEADPLIHLFDKPHVIVCPSVVFLHYIQFLCFNQLNDITQLRDSLQRLHWTVKNYCIGRISLLKIRSCLYLCRAYQIIGNEKEALFWLSSAHRIKDKSSKSQ